MIYRLSGDQRNVLKASTAHITIRMKWVLGSLKIIRLL